MRMNFITSRKLLMGALISALSACAGGPQGQEIPVTANAVQEISKLDTEIKEASSNQVNVLSPENFKNAQESLDKATKRSKDGSDNKEILESVAKGHAYLDKALKVAEKSRSSMQEVVDARQRAIDAGAATYFRDDFGSIDKDLRDVTEDIEDNDTSGVARNRDKLLQAYLDIELRGIQEARLGEPRKIIAQARKEGAEKLAPQTLKEADKAVTDADSYIIANRHKTDEVASRSNEALAEAQHVLKITQEAKSSKDASPEQLALGLEKERQNVAAKQALLTKQEGKTQAMAGKNEALASKNAGLNAAAAMTEQLQAVRGKFKSNEAEVFQQGKSVLVRLKTLAFPVGQTVLKSENFAVLAKVQEVIAEFPGSKVVVEGHTDDRGSSATNEKLSKERAQAVVNYLASSGNITADRMTAVGYGFSKPIAPNKTAEGRAQNRRVDVVVTPAPNEANM